MRLGRWARTCNHPIGRGAKRVATRRRETSRSRTAGARAVTASRADSRTNSPDVGSGGSCNQSYQSSYTCSDLPLWHFYSGRLLESTPARCTSAYPHVTVRAAWWIRGFSTSVFVGVHYTTGLSVWADGAGGHHYGSETLCLTKAFASAKAQC